MRIIAGNLRGSTLYITKNKTTRPLKDLVRESIFNLLTHSNKILFRLDRSNILDLYSGTGSFGLECLSRNAKSVFFVENERNAYNILEKNIKKLSLEKKIKVFFSDVLNFIEKEKYFDSKFDLIFIDPPFKDTSVEKLISLIFKKNLLNKNGVLILHRSFTSKEKFPNSFQILEERVYGVSKIIFGKFLV